MKRVEKAHHEKEATTTISPLCSLTEEEETKQVLKLDLYLSIYLFAHLLVQCYNVFKMV